MKYALSDNGVAVGYSPAERALFDLLPMKPKKVSSADLVKLRYGTTPPFHGQSIIGSTARSLAKKVDANKEPFRVAKSERAGPKPTEYWLEKRK